MNAKNMKFWLCLAAICGVAFWWGEQALAETETVEGVTWSYTVTSGTATVTGASPAEGELKIPPSLKGFTVTSIGNNAFSSCSNLVSVTLPDTVTNIGNRAFLDCSGMKNLDIGNGVMNIRSYAFYGCSGLSSIAIPESVRAISTDAFSKCSGLSSISVAPGNEQYSSRNGLLLNKDGTTLLVGINGDVTIPDGVTSIGNNAFSSCPNLTSVSLPDTVTNIGNRAFLDCSGLKNVDISNGVMNIGSLAFSGCSGLSSVAIPASVRAIATDAFSKCSGLSSISVAAGNEQYSSRNGLLLNKDGTTLLVGINGDVTIPDGVKNIGEKAFSYCGGLTSVAIPESVWTIGTNAFYGCSALTSVTIPNTVIKIGGGAFGGCSGLSSVAIPESVWTIGTNAFSGCSALKSVTIPQCVCSAPWSNVFPGVYTNLKAVVIGNNVTNIGHRTFSGCIGLTSVTIPEGVKTIGSNAFSNCRGLASVTIPPSVKSIGEAAFSGCIGLTSVTIPEGVRDLGAKAFAFCSGLTSVTILSDVGKDWVWVDEYCARWDIRPFAGCDNLETVVLGGNVGKIGNGMFSGCGGLKNVTISGSVTCIGSEAFSYCGSLTSVVIPEGVREIGDWAFSECRGLSSVSIPHSVESIGASAFWECSMLFDTNTIPGLSLVDGWVVQYMGGESGVLDLEKARGIAGGALSGCGQLTSVIIPECVRGIGAFAFSECRNLATVSIAEGVTRIGDSAFADCSGLTVLTIPDSVTNFEWNALSGCTGLTSLVIGDGVTLDFDVGYDNGVNYECGADWLSNMTNLVIGNGVKSIGDGAFCGVSNLTSVTIGNGVTRIGHCAFEDCISLTEVTIPDSVTSIGNQAFCGCSSLTTVTIPESVTDCAYDVFLWGCPSMQALYVPESWRENPLCDLGLDGVDGLPETCIVVYGKSYETLDDVDWVFIKSNGVAKVIGVVGTLEGVLEIPGELGGCTVTELDMSMGTNTNLTGVVIPETVTNITEGVFRGCGGVKTAVVPQCACAMGLGRLFPDSYRGIEEVAIYEGTANIGNYAFSGCTNLTKVNIPASVTSIGVEAFRGCAGLTSVAFPGGIRYIGSQAFSGCTGLERVEAPQYVCSRRMSNLFPDAYARLKEVSIAEGVTSIGAGAFSGCAGLKTMTIPPGVTTIGAEAFSGCTGLESVTIPEGVASIGEKAFQGCAKLRELAIPKSVETVGAQAFWGCGGLERVEIPPCVFTGRFSEAFPDAAATIREVVLGEGVSNVWSGAFSGCAGLESVTIPWGVTNIGTQAFAGCGSLASLVIPESVGQIGVYAFDGCAGLESVALPTGLAVIGNGTFRGCVRLAAVRIPDGATRIEKEAFSGCVLLSEVDLPDGLESIGDEAFAGCEALTWLDLPGTLVDWGARSLPEAMLAGLEYGADGFLVLNGWVLGYRDSGASALELPNGVVGVGNHALADFWDLETVEMPDSLRYIGRGAFETNTYLDNVVIPDGVEWVRDGAFQGCTYIRNLTIGESVAHIGRLAFAGCTQLATVSVPESVEEIGDGAFSNCWRMLSVKLPLGLKEAGTGIFAGCTSLTGVTMPAHAFTAARLFGERYAALASVSVVGGETAVCVEAFKGCVKLSSVALPEGVEEIGDGAFSGCRALPELELPGTLTQIGSKAFEGCTGLKGISLPDSVVGMGSNAFLNCTGLSNVTLSRSLAGIPGYAFQGCGGMESLVVPASVKTLGAHIGDTITAFYFLGNAPSYDPDAYPGSGKTVTTYVMQGSRGWDGSPSSRDLPPSWIGHPITYWEPNRFDAHFDANGGLFGDGSAVWSCEQITGVGYVLPPLEPALEGSDFDGWWTDPEEGAQIKATTQVNETREITFYAHWKGSPVPVTVRFNANGGTVEPTERVYQATLAYGTLPVPTRVHYRFTGWWTAAEGGHKVVATSRVPGADQELFAHWTPEPYAIRFHANGGTGTMADQSITYGNPVMLRGNAFAREGWEFMGWAMSEGGAAVYADGAQFGDIAAAMDGVIHLYAAWWRDPVYAVRFDANGGTGRMDNQTFRIGEEQALTLCQFEREGFRFLGWGRTVGGGVAFEDGAVVKDLTDEPGGAVALYAVWEKLPEPEALPEVAGDEEVANVLAGATDTRLGEHIQTVATYGEFRAWALQVKGKDGEVAGAEAVLASEHAWPSYLLGAETLFGNEPDIRLDGFVVGAVEARVGGETMTVRVTVKDGVDVATVDADKVAALFTATGDLCDWDGDGEGKLVPVVETAETGADGTMTFTVRVGDGMVGKAFLGIRE